MIERIIKKDFRYVEMVLSYANTINYWISKIYARFDYFHIWGTVTMNQVLNVSKHLETADDKPPLDHFTTSDILIKKFGANTGISAMSISI